MAFIGMKSMKSMKSMNFHNNFHSNFYFHFSTKTCSAHQTVHTPHILTLESESKLLQYNNTIVPESEKNHMQKHQQFIQNLPPSPIQIPKELQRRDPRLAISEDEQRLLMKYFTTNIMPESKMLGKKVPALLRPIVDGIVWLMVKLGDKTKARRYQQLLQLTTNCSIQAMHENFHSLGLPKDQATHLLLYALHLWILHKRLSFDNIHFPNLEAKKMTGGLFDIYWYDLEKDVTRSTGTFMFRKTLKDVQAQILGMMVALDRTLIIPGGEEFKGALFRNIYGDRAKQLNHKQLGLLHQYVLVCLDGMEKVPVFYFYEHLWRWPTPPLYIPSANPDNEERNSDFEKYKKPIIKGDRLDTY